MPPKSSDKKTLWAIITLGEYYKAKVKVQDYEILSAGSQINITTIEGQQYITHLSNVILSTKEPITSRTWVSQ